MVSVKFLGSWKECILANAAAPNAGRAKLVQLELSWLVACDVSSSLFSQKKSEFHCVESFDESSWR